MEYKNVGGADMERDTEPLLKQHHPDVETGPEEHQWEGGLWKCCGTCDNTGWLSCLLANYLPCVAVGLNFKRVFSGSAIRHALVFAVMVFLAYCLRVVNVVALANNCVPPPPPGLRGFRAFPLPPHRPAANPVARVFAGPNPGPPTPLCGRLEPVRLGLSAALLAYALFLVCYMAARRTQIREKLNIPGSRLGDFCTWFWCGACALCQETRTLWHNNVHEGVWHGPAPAPFNGVILSAPTAPVMGKQVE